MISNVGVSPPPTPPSNHSIIVSFETKTMLSQADNNSLSAGVSLLTGLLPKLAPAVQKELEEKKLAEKRNAAQSRS